MFVLVPKVLFNLKLCRQNSFAPSRFQDSEKKMAQKQITDHTKSNRKQTFFSFDAGMIDLDFGAGEPKFLSARHGACNHHSVCLYVCVNLDSNRGGGV